MLGVFANGVGYMGCWSIPRFQGGASFHLQCLHDFFKVWVSQRGYLPEVLFLQEDNSGRDNKNNVSLAFFGHLVQQNVFHQVHIYFMPVGHTHCLIDQCHSVTARELSQNDLVSINQMIKCVRHLFTTSSTFVQHVVMDTTADFKEYFEGCTHRFTGLGTCRIDGQKRRVHGFRISRDDAGRAVIEIKEHDEASSVWRGHWRTNKPLRIFQDEFTLPTQMNSVKRTQIPDYDQVKLRLEAVKELFSKAGKQILQQEGGGKDVERVRDFQEGLRWFDAFFEKEDNEAHLIEQRVPEFFFDWLTYRQPSDSLSEETKLILEAIDCPDPEQISQMKIPYKVKGRIVQCAEIEVNSTCRKGRNDTAVYLSHDVDEAPCRATFDPAKDLKAGMAVLVQLQATESTFNRGWDLGKVFRLFEEGGQRLAVVHWLEPSTCVTPTEWPKDWATMKLKVPNVRIGNKSVPFNSPDIPINNVVWAFNLTKAKHVQKKDQQTLLAQIERLNGAVYNFYLPVRDMEDDDTDFEPEEK